VTNEFRTVRLPLSEPDETGVGTAVGTDEERAHGANDHAKRR
jgi:hypothetical protein